MKDAKHHPTTITPNSIDMDLMAEVFHIFMDDEGRGLVDARELHQWLKVEETFHVWLRKRVDEYGLSINEDYVVYYDGNTPEVSISTVRLTMDTARGLALVECSDRGQAARRYFIAVEKAAANARRPAEVYKRESMIYRLGYKKGMAKAKTIWMAVNGAAHGAH